MNWIDPYIFLLMILAISTILVTAALLRPPRKLLRTFLAIAIGMIGIFITLTVMELLSNDRSTMIVLRNLQQIPLIFVPLLLFGYAKELYKEEGWKTVRLLGILSIPSLIDLTLVLTDAYHSWMREGITIREIWNYTEVSTSSTALSAFLGSYTFVLTLFTIFVLVRNMFDVPKQYRMTHGLSALVIAIPLIAITVVPFLPFEVPALFALSYGSMGLMLIITNKRKDFNTVWPVSRQTVLDNMTEGIMLVDDKGYIVEVNRALCEMVRRLYHLECEPKELLRKPVGHVFPDVRELEDAICRHTNASFSYEQEEGYFDITVTMVDEKYQLLHLVVMKDVTDKKNIERKLEALANYDQLTMLMNRKAFMNAYGDQDETEKIFILMDIDYFKRFNDRYGHVVGDEVLRYMGEAMGRHFVEKGDVVARLGGEEFGILTDSSPEEMKRRLENFSKCLKVNSSKVNPVIEDAITVSVGMYSFEGEKSFEYVYHKADEAMYQAKHNGRDRIHLADNA